MSFRKRGGWGFYYLTDKIHYVWRKLFVDSSLKLKFNFESSTWTVEVTRTRFPCPGLLDFLRNLFFLKKKKSEIWEKYGQWCYCFKFLEIRLHWLLHVDFGEIRFLKWRDVINSNSRFWAIKGFSEGLPLFKLIFFLKIKKNFNRNRYFTCQILTSDC